MKPIQFIRWFLLALIIIGLVLLATQKVWVPKLVDYILAQEDSSSNTQLKYFGNEAYGDLNFDGIKDKAYLMTKDDASQTFYAVVDIKTKDGYESTNPFYVGTGISPQPMNIIAGELHVNYAQVSAGKVLLLKVTPEGVLEGLMK